MKSCQAAVPEMWVFCMSHELLKVAPRKPCSTLLRYFVTVCLTLKQLNIWCVMIKCEWSNERWFKQEQGITQTIFINPRTLMASTVEIIDRKLKLKDRANCLFSLMMRYIRDTVTFLVFLGKKPTLKIKKNGVCQSMQHTLANNNYQ